MATDSTSSPVPHPPPVRGHERRDANPKWIFAAVVCLLILVLCTHWILADYLSLLKRGPSPTDAWRPVKRTGLNAPALPAFPRLQISPPADLQAFRAGEEAELNSYGWINRTSGTVRIPIERAIDLVLQEGLPTRRSSNANQSGPSSYQLIQQRANHRESEIKANE